MKGKIFVIILIFLVMGTVPIVTILGNNQENPLIIPDTFSDIVTENTPSTAEEAKPESKTLSQKEIIKGMIFAVYDESFNEETIKALTVLFQSNLKADNTCVDTNNREIFISEEEFKNTYNSYEEIITQINNTMTSVENIYIYNSENQTEYIPYSQCSCGYTVTDENQPELIQVASPWDTFSKNYDSENKCVGVSIDGIKFLTENNNDYLTALKWYLPKYTIEG